MEGIKQEAAYGTHWFEQRALQNLKKIGDRDWDYSDSLLLYLPGSDETYGEIQESETPYNTLITIPERKYLQHIAPEVVRMLPDSFEYIDLGPGTEHKEQFIFDAAKSQHKHLLYRPVDISEHYLRLSTAYAKDQRIEASPLRSAFEELPEKLEHDQMSRFVSIGLTYGNYKPQEILTLLQTLAGENGAAFINAHIRDRFDTDAIRAIYAEAGAALAQGKLRLLGLDPAQDIAATEATDEVKVWCTLKNVSAALEAKGVQTGDRLLVLQSLRPTLEALENDIMSFFPNAQLLDTGEQFVGAVLKK